MEQFEGVMNPIYSDVAYVEKLRKELAEAEPYPHSVLNPLCNHDFLVKVHNEVKENLKANFKETDLYKLFQTDELSTLSEETLMKEMPNLLKLRKVLYSKEWRETVSKIAHCNAELNEVLTDRIDCSINAYANSCHLLCHDDVIGTRCLSYIIYLPNPEEEWKPEDGGAVELYPLDSNSIVTKEVQQSKATDGKMNGLTQEQGIPVTNPTKCLLPNFNQMLLFKVLPGKSYHSVQEVFNKDSPRLSISGWYHTEQPPIGSDFSSLKLIMKYGDEQLPVTPLPKEEKEEEEEEDEEEENEELNDEDIDFLKKYIAKEYLNMKNLKKLQKNFIKNSSIQLQEFLRKDFFLKLQKEMILIDSKEGLGKGKPSLDYEIGLKDNSLWKLVGPCHKRRYLQLIDNFNGANNDDNTSSELGNLHSHLAEQLSFLKNTLFLHQSFLKLVRIMTTLPLKGYRSEVRRFRPGLDYTVAHYGIITREPWLDMNLCFVNDDKDFETAVFAEQNKQKKNKKRKEVPSLKKKLKKSKKLPSLRKSKKDEESNSEVEEGEEEYQEEDQSEEKALDDEDYGSDYGELWEDGDVGGFECYIEAENDADNVEAAEVYRYKKDLGEEKEEEENTTLLSLSACSNSLSLVLRDEGIMKFIKYVSANAPGSRWDVAVEFELEKTDEDDEEEEDDEENEESDEDDDEDEDEDA
jgi:Rps23 Pro-64 3,4-dihydroxylase Tpa1-like proline 4-hydroxylase